LIVDATFSSSNDGFQYEDSLFRNTTQPAYSSGSFTNGAAVVVLGGLDYNTILGMSGGFLRSFSLIYESTVTVEIVFQMNQGSGYEDDEYSDALCSVDGKLLGATKGIDYLARLVGDGGDGTVGPIQTTGLKTLSLSVGILAPGTHNIAVGGFNNKKTYPTEITTIVIDAVRVIAAVTPRKLELEHQLEYAATDLFSSADVNGKQWWHRLVSAGKNMYIVALFGLIVIVWLVVMHRQRRSAGPILGLPF
jgi:hypothetical protein